MRYRGYRLDIIISLAVITVLILVAGQIAYGQVFIERPLLDELQNIPGVTTATVEKVAVGYDITLKLSPVSRLPSVYRQAYDVARKILDVDDFTIRIIDNRTPLLEDLYGQMQIHIEEAVMQGNFSAAAERLNEMAAIASVNEKFHVDEECIYLELYQDQAYLFEVRHRVLPQRGAVAKI